ncbi:MAG TPA: hypothetical protein VFO77_07210, partial [Actinoplanes sp.]|nr:hypothetical protein [Actinoplanes sp.]
RERMVVRFIGDTTRVWTGLAGEYDVRLFSVDARRPELPPRPERGDTLRLDRRGRAAREYTVSVVGRPDWGGVLYRTKDQVLKAIVQSEYTCDTPITARVLGCWGRGRYGAIATLTAHGAAGRITMRRLAPTSLGLTSYLVGSPDGSTVLFWVPKDGWYSVPADGSAAPTWEFPTVGVGAESPLPIDWI